MQPDLDASKIVCRICGVVSVLPTDAGESAERLAAFTAEHSMHDDFRIDVVTGPVHASRLLELPLQRERGVEDRANTA